VHLPDEGQRTWRTLKTAAGITDRRRWKNPSDPGYLQTAERNRMIAASIPRGSTVLDLGAGIQQLRRFLPRDCEYQPCDLDGGPDVPPCDFDVLPCDFNAGRYPTVTHRYDVLVASGLLEFLRDPEAFLAQLPALGDMLLLSYRVRPSREAPWRRLQWGYMNHLTTADLEAMLDRLGYRWENVGVFTRGSGSHSIVQLIYRVALESGQTGRPGPHAPPAAWRLGQLPAETRHGSKGGALRLQDLFNSEQLDGDVRRQRTSSLTRWARNAHSRSLERSGHKGSSVLTRFRYGDWANRRPVSSAQ
jgi:hypothetical protein